MSLRTIPRKWPADAPRGDHPARCDYCGVPWRRSQMRRDASGLLACPDDIPGLDAVTLSKGNADGIRKSRVGLTRRDGALEGGITDVAPAFTSPNNPQQLPPRGFGG